ncbi:RNA-binding protein [Selenomonas sp. oral taxon 126]|uniref:RNA-binding cell elongation regulator Jag/EloR n=1 Tax=Selenomonas sp. oral taxon 126 TaxID=712528 RepID=UPI0008078451|nr:RNA-binding cell elongation regulator Jag/EloR [Selenomonas sp. oral taxon 126]ANR70224.1 RNA-binding protein [Selenomonas sp. oral taxon 126]
MAEIIETTGRTVEDALSHALDKLGCGREEVTYEIVQEPSGGFLGLWGKREARIRVTTRPVIPPQRTEIQTPAPPTVLAPSPQPSTMPQEERAQDEGFGIKKRFHTDLRSSARKAAEQSAPQRGGEQRRENIARGGYGDRQERPARMGEERRAPRESSGQGGYGERRERGGYGETRERSVRSRYGDERQDFRRERRERPSYERTGAGYEGSHRERTDSQLIPLTDEMMAAAEKFLGEIFAAMGLSVTLHRTDTPSGTIFNMQGDSLGILIGKHGATLDSLQYLTNLVVNKIPETGYARIILDVEDYRARREETLTRLAGHLADKACRIGEEIHLEPMSRHERKIIHMALQDNRRVTTYSAGDNPRRYVVIVPRRRRYTRDYEEQGYDRYER